MDAGAGPEETRADREPSEGSGRLPDVDSVLDIPLLGVTPLAAPAALDFRTFYEAHRPRIARALALTLGDASLGAEAADEAMTRAYARWSTVSGYRNPEGWVYRVGVNWGRSFLRRRRREEGTVYVEEAAELEVTDPAIRRALQELPVDFRTVVVCRFHLDWSVEQTAAALGVAPGTVKSRLSRGLARLEAALAEGVR
jgi:RNA polymerase sigma factor (sigma-70 family)